MSNRIRIWSFSDQDRSGKVRWTANELGYEVEEVRVKPGEHLADPYRQLNPYQQIPTVELDGKTMIESTAICLALAERHPQAALIPAGQEARDRFWESINLSATTLETPVVMCFLAKIGIVDAAWAELWAPVVDRRLAEFAGRLPQDTFICGEFSLADICAAYVLRIAVQAGLLPLEGELENYLHRLMARPPAQAARFFDSLEA